MRKGRRWRERRMRQEEKGSRAGWTRRLHISPRREPD